MWTGANGDAQGLARPAARSAVRSTVGTLSGPQHDAICEPKMEEPPKTPTILGSVQVLRVSLAGGVQLSCLLANWH